MRTLIVVLLAVGSLVLAGCPGEDDPKPVDAAISDGAIPDAGAPDADPMVICTEYCECMADRCEGSFADTPTCMTVCLGLDSAAQDCRVYHCGLATPGNEPKHCPHARGEAICD